MVMVPPWCKNQTTGNSLEIGYFGYLAGGLTSGQNDYLAARTGLSRGSGYSHYYLRTD